MKNISILLIGLFISAILIYFVNINKKSNLNPLPTEIITKNSLSENERKKERDKWIENMHKTKEGVSWKKIDNQTRFDNYLRKGNIPKNSKENLANGNLIGEWHEKGSVNQSGRTHYAEYDPDTDNIYCGSDGGQIWKGTIDGNNWISLNDNLKMSSFNLIRLIPHNTSKRLLVSTGERFYYSDDDGSSWDYSTGLSGIENWGFIIRSVVVENSEKTIFLLAYEWDYTNWNAITSIYISHDHGESFSQIDTFAEAIYGNNSRFDIWTQRYTESEAFLINNNDLYTLDKTTGSRTLVTSFTINSEGKTLLTGCKTPTKTHLYAYIDQNIYYSQDAGLNWTYMSDINNDPFFHTSFSCAINDSTKLFFGGVECFYSYDSGSTWNKVNNWGDYYSNPDTKLHADIPSIIPILDSENDEFLLINTDGGIYKSFDYLQTVSNISLLGLNVSQYYSVYTNKTNTNYVYAGSQDQGYQRCDLDDGSILNLEQLISGDYGHIVSSNDGQSIWTDYPGFVMHYSNAATGIIDGWWDFDMTGNLWMPPLMADPNNSSNVYIAGGHLNSSSGTKIIKVNTSGVAEELSYDFQTLSASASISAMAYSKINNDYRYVLTENGKFFYSTNSGQNWTISSSFTGPEPHYFYGACVLPSIKNLNTIYISGSGYSNPGVYKSTNNGESFTSMSTDLPSTLIYQLTSNHNETLIFAATEVGPYVYVVTEDKWYNMAGTGAPDQTFWSVEYISSNHTVRFGTYGRGIWDFVFDPSTVSIKDYVSDFDIKIYPNPAHDFIILETSNAKEVIIYDIKGSILYKAKIDKNKIRINTSYLRKGTYLVTVISDQGNFNTQKVFLQ